MSTLGLYDYTLLTLVFFIFLIGQILRVFVVVGVGCAEQWGSFGLITMGPFSGWTLWHTLYYFTLLSAAYGLVSLLSYKDKNRGLRCVLIIALLIGAQGFRMGLADDVPAAPDGFLMVWPENAMEQSEVSLNLESIRYFHPVKVCVFLEGNKVALNWSDTEAPWAKNTDPEKIYLPPKLPNPWVNIFSPRGSLYRGLLESQSYRPLTADERHRFLEQQERGVIYKLPEGWEERWDVPGEQRQIIVDYYK
jgi:hypothetical protein